MDAIDQLYADHELILDAVTAFDKIASNVSEGAVLPASDVMALLDFFRVFLDAAHHAKEETILFPAMVGAGLSLGTGPLAMMCAEHDEGSALFPLIAETVKAAGSDPSASRSFVNLARVYVTLLRQHIRKENEVLFRVARDRFAPVDLVSMLAAFSAIEIKVLGRDGRDRAIATIQQVARSAGASLSTRVPVAARAAQR